MAGAEERIMFLEGMLIMTESQWQRYLRRSARLWAGTTPTSVPVMLRRM